MGAAKVRIGVIGAGNTLMGDDGVGIAVLELLRGKLPEKVELVDLGTAGLSLLHILAKLDIAIIVDAVDFGGSPGESRIMTPEEVRSTKKVGLSTHDCDLLGVIELSRGLGECPGAIVILAIQPYKVGPSTELSRPIRDELYNFVGRIVKMVRDMADGSQT